MSVNIANNMKKIWNVGILEVDLVRGKLTVCRKKREAGKDTYILTTIFVGIKPRIKDTSGKRLKLSDIEPRDRATIDCAVENQALVASKIIVDKYIPIPP